MNLIILIFASLFQFVVSHECDYYDYTTVKYNLVYRCPDGWTEFSRYSGKWCIRIYHGPYQFDSAEVRCNTVGGTLSGIENANERLWVEGQATYFNHLNGKTAGRYWLGAKRRNECDVPNWRNVPSCVGANAYQWTDNSTNVVSGFAFRRDQPDFNQNIQSCVIMDAVDKPTIINGITFIATSLMDDINCNEFTDGFVCGRKQQLFFEK